MGKEYRELTGIEGVSQTTAEMRKLCQRPGKRDTDGNIIYFTEQHHKNECDVNRIIKKYDRNGLITHISKIEAQFGDVSGLDFKASLDLIHNAQKMFDELPSKIRNRFKNDPYEILTFMEDPNNREEAIELGLIKSIWTEATDGLGEHVKEGENINKDINPATEPPN